MGVLELPLFRRSKNIILASELHAHLGSPAPHVADPNKSETLVELQHAVRSSRADMGVAYDGDADRIGFVDETGSVLSANTVMAILSRVVLREHPRATILYDVRTSRAVEEEIRRWGGNPVETAAGHANIKHRMREENAAFAGELTSHFYFSEGGYAAEMGSLPAILLMNEMARERKTLSELAHEITAYHHSGEINFHIRDPYHLFEELRLRYGDGKLSTLDGLKFCFPDWWFSVRSSNTEPVVRLVIEANSAGELDVHRQELTRFIERFA